ncbi:unnamed protein product, partial [Notodromas monacha]
MSLGIKQLTPDPWTDITAKYPINSKHTGTVRNFTNFGVFVELEEGVDGLVYISDLSWTQKIKHPSEFCTAGDKLEVQVLELDVDNRRLSLGVKQLETNPWDVYEQKYAIGSDHEGVAIEVFEKGATIQLEDAEIDAFVPGRHLDKEDGSKVAKGDKLMFKVIEFGKDQKRVVLSHTATFKEEEQRQIKAVAEKQQQTSEKSTLGDIDALSELKKKMEG